jgi:hypothetical protein
MAATTEPSEPTTSTRTRRTEESTYVVQVLQAVDNPDGDADAWFDVATVTVPARTKRKRVITEGLTKAGLDASGAPLKVRVLNADSAHVSTVQLKTPAPQLTIG